MAESIRAQAVRLGVLEVIRREMKKTPTSADKRSTAAEHIKTLEMEIERYRILRMQLYEDKAAGIISVENHQQFGGSFTKKLEAVLEAKSRIEEGLIVIRYYLALRRAENGVIAMVTPFFCVRG